MSDPLLQTLADLIRINSVNPNYDGGVAEVELARYVDQYFRDRGIETFWQSVYPERPNVIAKIPGRDSSRRIIFEAHLDTVSVAGMTIEPWNPEIRDGKMYGRGSCDTKAGMAAMMHAAACLVESNITPACDVWFAATIDEEFSYRGVLALCNQLPANHLPTDLFASQGPLVADAAIVAEPTSLQPVIASKGLVRWKIRANGKAAHSAKPHLGINAIEHIARVITALEIDTVQLAKRTHRLLGSATCNVGLLRGGTQINFVPDHAEIEIDRRLLPGETVETVLSHYQSILDRLSGEHPSMNLVMQPPMLTDVPLETDPESSAVQTMGRVLEKLGLDSTLVGVPFCSDASKFGALGIPSLILGPGCIDQAHAAIEYVECEQVIQAAEIYRRFMIDFE